MGTSQTPLRSALAEVIARLGHRFPKLNIRAVTSLELTATLFAAQNHYGRGNVVWADRRNPICLEPSDGAVLLLGGRDITFPILIATHIHDAKPETLLNLALTFSKARAACFQEAIFPFVAFCDRAAGSGAGPASDAIAAIGHLGAPNVERLFPESRAIALGTFHARVEDWGQGDLRARCLAIAERSVHYYLAKYGKAQFE